MPNLWYISNILVAMTHSQLEKSVGDWTISMNANQDGLPARNVFSVNCGAGAPFFGEAGAASLLDQVRLRLPQLF